jgi:hypothetical protein
MDVIGKDVEFNSGDGNAKTTARGSPNPNEFIVT